MAYDEKTAARVRKVLSRRRDVVEKKLMGGLSFMVKGALCCSVSGRGGLLIRIGVDAQERWSAHRRSPTVWGLQPRRGCDSLRCS
jgi:hypothetical protein